MHVDHMPKMIQLRHVPDDLHTSLKVHATEARMSLSDYLVKKLEEIERMSNWNDFFSRLRYREPVDLGNMAARMVREDRDAR